MTIKFSLKWIFWLLIGVALLQPSVAQAYGGILTHGRPIASTPFDDKVYGVLPEEPLIRRLPKKSVDDLFAVARSFRYVHVPESPWRTPEEIQASGSGDCADKSVWLYDQLKKNSYENVHLVIGKYRRIDSFFHVWVVYVDDQGKTFLLDPTIQKRIWESGQFKEGFYTAFYSYDGENRYYYDSLRRTK